MPAQVIPPLGRNVRLKIIALVSVAILVAAFTEKILPIPNIIAPFVPLFVAFITGALITVFLRPVNDLYQSARNMVAGQPPLPLHSKDEFQSIGDLLIQLADQENHLKVLSQQHALSVTSEQSKLEGIINAMTDAVFVVNLNRQVVIANQKAEQLTGVLVGNMKNRPLDDWLKLKDLAGNPVLSTRYCPLSLSRFETSPSELLTLANNPTSTNTLSIVSTHLNTTVQTDWGWVVVLKSQQRQQELESSQVDFVSMASHELRTPITSIKGYLSVFMEENKGKFDADQNGLLERMWISTLQLVSLVDNLLNVAKVERGAFSVNLTPTDWTKTLTMAVDENKIMASQKNIAIEVQFPPTPLPQVMADNIRIMEVINNLVGNAINYTPSGGHITVNTRVDGSFVVTSITDTGMGIPADAIPKLFHKFFRVAGALDRSSNSKGSGLGLYLSKSIIDLHKGKIWVESQVGKGSTFSFSLPVAQQSDTAASILKSVQMPTTSASSATVLT